MARFILKFDCDNAAFADGDAPHEIARILREIADHMEEGSTSGHAIDGNGNIVGKFFYEPPEED
jgi:hypothetical protein